MSAAIRFVTLVLADSMPRTLFEIFLELGARPGLSEVRYTLAITATHPVTTVPDVQQAARACAGGPVWTEARRRAREDAQDAHFRSA